MGKIFLIVATIAIIAFTFLFFGFWYQLAKQNIGIILVVTVVLLLLIAHIIYGMAQE